jgi:hypothetical protein
LKQDIKIYGKNGRYPYYSEYARYTKTFAIENSSLFFKSGICPKISFVSHKKSIATKINIK